MLVKFEVYHDGEYWCARGIGVDILTQGKTMDEAISNIREVVEVHFGEKLGSGEPIRVLSISEFEVQPVQTTRQVRDWPRRPPSSQSSSCRPEGGGNLSISIYAFTCAFAAGPAFGSV